MFFHQNWANQSRLALSWQHIFFSALVLMLPRMSHLCRVRNTSSNRCTAKLCLLNVKNLRALEHHFIIFFSHLLFSLCEQQVTSFLCLVWPLFCLLLSEEESFTMIHSTSWHSETLALRQALLTHDNWLHAVNALPNQPLLSTRLPVRRVTPTEPLWINDLEYQNRAPV